MKDNKYEPLGEAVLLYVEPEEEKTDRVIILPDGAEKKETLLFAKVSGIGPAVDKSHYPIKVGDTVTVHRTWLQDQDPERGIFLVGVERLMSKVV